MLTLSERSRLARFDSPLPHHYMKNENINKMFVNCHRLHFDLPDGLPDCTEMEH
jgi:hypothetical protein